MNEMSKFQRSWLLLKSSVLIIARNQKLLVFPIVTGLLYAAEGFVAEPYNQQMLDSAWKFKKS